MVHLELIESHKLILMEALPFRGMLLIEAHLGIYGLVLAVQHGAWWGKFKLLGAQY